MAEIIDLEFYRKFKIILPVRHRTLVKNSPYGVARFQTKKYRRRRKAETEQTQESKIKNKE